MKSLRESIIDFIYRSATAPEEVRRRLAPLGAGLFISLIVLLILASVAADRLLGLPALAPWRRPICGPAPVRGGAALWLWSVLQFVQAKGTPIPLNPPPKLIEDGPYRYLRNPMLAGVFIMLLGLGCCCSPGRSRGFHPAVHGLRASRVQAHRGAGVGSAGSAMPTGPTGANAHAHPEASFSRMLLFVLPVPAFIGPPSRRRGLSLEKIKLPPGFQIDIYARGSRAPVPWR